jgi:hypothetical protein
MQCLDLSNILPSVQVFMIKCSRTSTLYFVLLLQTLITMPTHGTSEFDGATAVDVMSKEEIERLVNSISHEN